MTSRWFNPTGGFGYHVRALLYGRSRWSPFRQEIARWLRAWAPPERELLLVGPSGGYSLDPAFLCAFSRIIAVDIDPLAALIFRLRFGRLLRDRGVALAWDSRDHLSPGPQGFSLRPLCSLVAAHPEAAVLFCNLLGQLPMLGDDRLPDQSDDDPPEGSYERWLLGLPAALAGRSWATYHDRISGDCRPRSLPEGSPSPGPLRRISSCTTSPPPRTASRSSSSSITAPACCCRTRRGSSSRGRSPRASFT